MAPAEVRGAMSAGRRDAAASPGLSISPSRQESPGVPTPLDLHPATSGLHPTLTAAGSGSIVNEKGSFLHPGENTSPFLQNKAGAASAPNEGPAGIAGLAGIAGTPGTTGIAGFAGTPGTTGIVGTTGLAGKPVTTEISEIHGTPGIAATSGNAGTTGTIGPAGIPEASRETRSPLQEKNTVQMRARVRVPIPSTLKFWMSLSRQSSPV